MAHYAQIDENNIVVNVIVVGNDFTEDVNYLTETYGPTWIITSYNTRGNIHYNPVTGESDDETPVHYNYASLGYQWDPEGKAFYNPVSIYPSWILDRTTYTWVPPIPKPEDWPDAVWNEPTKCWAIKSAPFNSWHYNVEIEKWEPPISMPDGIKAIWSEARHAWIVIPPPYPSWEYDPYTNAWVPPVGAPIDINSQENWSWSWDDVAQKWYPDNPLVQ